MYNKINIKGEINLKDFDELTFEIWAICNFLNKLPAKEFTWSQLRINDSQPIERGILTTDIQYGKLR